MTDWIQTYTGRKFHPLDPAMTDFDLRDIAHSLSLLCRFNGHCLRFYSVAEHSVRVSRILPDDLKLWGLLHDAGEAYLTDLPRPVKGQMPGFRDMEDKIVEYVTLREVKNLSFANARPIAEKLSEMFNNGEFDVCTVYYNAFKSVISQVVTAQQLVPVKLPDADEAAADEDAPDLGGAIYDYEPEENDLLGVLVPRNMSVQIYRSLLESGAAEHAARMTSMDNATRNAGDMIDGLTLTYNRTRQAIITKELIEIVSGAEAL